MPESIALMFTDIEGSTRLWESDAAGMSRALKAHDDLCLGAVSARGGWLVKTTGDGVFAAFPSTADAAAAALALQQALADPAVTGGVAIRVRCAVHTGEVERRGDDLFGPAVNRAARIMATAHGGQVLLSRAAVDAIGAGPAPAPGTFQDLGRVRLKDLATPEHVYQLVHDALRRDFPPLRSLERVPNNLPNVLTRFVGRERELREVSALVARHRLVTLVAMGGVGKTRLALQVAAEVLERFEDGVWFVDLAPLADPALLDGTVARALGVQPEAQRPLAETLARHLASRRLLIVLDNCEHLVDACATRAAALLAACPHLVVLATSREALRVPGEQVHPLGTLPLPAAGDSGPSDALTLLLDRVSLHFPNWQPGADEIAAAASICRQTDGIALALELAAARARSLTLVEIARRLQDRFKFLDHGARNLPERQRTLNALVGWSYDLLAPAEQQLLEVCGIFAGGFRLESLQAVACDDPADADDAGDLLLSLVEKSLVIADVSGEVARYRMLDTLRHYARDKLAARGGTAQAAARHAAHFLGVAKRVRTMDTTAWLRRMEEEHENVREALSWLLGAGGDPVGAVKMEVALQPFRVLRGYAAEGIANLRKALASDAIGQMPVGKGHALYVCGVLNITHGDSDAAMRMLQECVDVRTPLGDREGLAGALSTLGMVHRMRGELDESLRLELEALAHFRDLGHRHGQAIGNEHLGHIERLRGRHAAARDYFGAAVEIGNELGDAEIRCDAWMGLAEVALDQGRLVEAEQVARDALEGCRAAGIRRGELRAQWLLGRVVLRAARHEEAGELLGAALAGALAQDSPDLAVDCIGEYAMLALKQGDALRCVRLEAAARQLRDALGLKLDAVRAVEFAALVAQVPARVAEADIQDAQREARGWSLQAAARYAVAAVAQGSDARSPVQSRRASSPHLER